jgi:CheY-like chemotaxis protein
MDAPLIAVVNDDPVFLALMREALESEGYRTLTWRGGQGVHAMLKHARPALLVLDLRLEMTDTGLTVLQTLRLDAATRHLPVIVCSADTRVLERGGDHLKAFGCRLLAKPFDLDVMLSLVREMIAAPS